VKELLKRCIIVVGQDDLSREAQQNATTLFQILIRCKLASKRVLRDYRLNKKAFEELLGQIEAKFNQAIVSPNEMVGVVAAQSIGEPTTQMTLNTFHYAGVGSKGKVTMGVPRLKEIINVTERMKTPSLTIYPVDSVRKDKSLIEKMHSHLAYTTLGDIVRATEIWYDPDPLNTVVGDEDEKRMVKFDIEVGELDVNTVSPWLLRIELFKQEVLVKNIEMDTIRNRIKEELDEDLVVIASEIGSDNLVLRIRCKRDVGAEKIMGDDDDGGNDDDDIPDNNSPDRFLAKVEEYLLKNLNIVGTKGISKAYYRHDKTNKSWDIEKGFSKDEEWVLSTDGTNLIETLNDENVDHARTVSNDIAEIFKVLGIEAVRRALVNEIRGTIASSGGGYINYRHLSVLVDSMTIRGYVMPITRHGLLSTNYGDLMKSSYEQTVEVLLKASALAQVDRLKGPTQNIMLGQTCPMGTGDMDCILDEEMLSSIVRTGNGIMTDDQIGISGISGAVPMTPGDNPTPLQADNLDQIMTSPVGMDDDDEMEFSPTNSPFFAGSQTPVGVQSPGVSTFGSVTSPGYDASVTPIQSPFNTPGYSGMSAQSPGYTDVGGRSPYLPQSPGYSSSGGSSSSPAYTGSIQSPVYSPTGGTTSGTSSLSSGTMGNKSTQYDPTSPAYSPMETGGMSSKIATTQSPSYSPMSSLGGGTTSPAYSPSGSGTNTQSQNDMSSSPAYSPFGGSDTQSGSTQYSPMSPAYTDQGGSGVSSNHFSTSPAYSPKSPFSNVAQTGSVNYSPMSPAYMDGQSTTGGAPAYSPQSPAYLGGNDVVVGDDTKREPTSPAYSPLSPGYQ
jgi:DNA-directed RNA polymerase II subunit RPB1